MHSRGNRYAVAIGNKPLEINISDCDRPTVNFEFYNSGVTNGEEVWKQLDAKVVVIEENGELIASGPAMVVGQTGNNAVYRVEFTSLLPKKVAHSYSETIHANIDIIIDGERELSLPVDCVNEP
jgi:hypothetical protein